MTSTEIRPLAQRLYDAIPVPLRTWQGLPTDPEVRDQLADTFLLICDDVGLTGEVTGDAETSMQAVIISEALAGFLTQWGCRYGNLDDDVDRAQAALVTALGGTVLEPGLYTLREGVSITVAAISHLVGWVTILDVPES